MPWTDTVTLCEAVGGPRCGELLPWDGVMLLLVAPETCRKTTPAGTVVRDDYSRPGHIYAMQRGQWVYQGPEFAGDAA